MTINITAWAGARKKMEANGLVRPIPSLRNRTSVRAHLRPPRADADMTCINLFRCNSET
jgi:hypothetical protein